MIAFLQLKINTDYTVLVPSIYIVFTNISLSKLISVHSACMVSLLLSELQYNVSYLAPLVSNHYGREPVGSDVLWTLDRFRAEGFYVLQHEDATIIVVVLCGSLGHHGAET